MDTTTRKRRSDAEVLAGLGAHAPCLTPLFGVKPGWSPNRTCDDVHPHGPIPSGSRCVCMACSKTGVERLVSGHVKPGSGQLRDGWDAPEPTKYVPIEQPAGKKQLRGGTGR